MIKKYEIFLIAVILMTGCGIKGPPLPPLENKYEILNSANIVEPATGNISGTTVVSGDKTKPKVKRAK